MAVTSSNTPVLSALERSRLQILFSLRTEPYIVFENEDLLVVNKPAGMHSVRRGPDIHDSVPAGTAVSLEEWLLKMVPALGIFPGNCSTIVSMTDAGMLSRLDGQTSGLILVAKNMPAFLRLQEARAQGQIRKTYVFVASLSEQPVPGARPEWSWATPELARLFKTTSSKACRNQEQEELEGSYCCLHEDSYLVESRFRPYGRGRMRVAPVAPEMHLPSGIEVAPGLYKTRFKAIVCEREERPQTAINASRIFMASIRSGFRHQIRVHAAWSGIPILGDTLYGGEAAQRLYLHSYSVEFPVQGAEILRIEDNS